MSTIYELVMIDEYGNWTNDGYGDEPSESEIIDEIKEAANSLRDVGYENVTFGARNMETREIVPFETEA